MAGCLHDRLREAGLSVLNNPRYDATREFELAGLEFGLLGLRHRRRAPAGLQNQYQPTEVAVPIARRHETLGPVRRAWRLPWRT